MVLIFVLGAGMVIKMSLSNKTLLTRMAIAWQTFWFLISLHTFLDAYKNGDTPFLPFLILSLFINFMLFVWTIFGQKDLDLNGN